MFHLHRPGLHFSDRIYDGAVMKKIIFIIAFVLLPSLVFADVTVTQSGTKTHGSLQTISISGGSFGTGPTKSNINWLQDTIESCSNGNTLSSYGETGAGKCVMPSGWTACTEGGECVRPTITTTSPVGGVYTKSIHAYVSGGSVHNSSWYHSQAGSDQLLAFFKVRVAIAGASDNVEWKLFRASKDISWAADVGTYMTSCVGLLGTITTVPCGSPYVAAYNYCGSVGDGYGFKVKQDGVTQGTPRACYCNSSGCSTSDEPHTTFGDGTAYITTSSDWYTFIVQSKESASGSLDGAITIWVQRGTGHPVKFFDANATMTRHDASQWVAFMAQNYFNSITTAYIDWASLYVQWGSWARVELVDGTSDATITHTEIQNLSDASASWSTSQIQVPLNRGAIAADATNLRFRVTLADGTQYNSDSFNLGTIQYNLNVTNAGHGTVTSSPSGINCGTACSASFDSGTAVTLTATPDSGYGVTWSGDCDSTGHVTMSAAKTCTATFSPLPVQYLPWVATQQ